MKNIAFPVNLRFKISTLSNDFTATDANGSIVAYVRQKMFKLKEDINVYSDESRSKVNYNIKADQWLDFSAAYSFSDENGRVFGKIARKGWKSLWKAHYEIIDTDEQQQYTVKEENAWIKVLDGLLTEIPFLGILSGYLLNPAYLVMDNNGKTVARLSKEPSFFGRYFKITQHADFGDDGERIMLGMMMMILLERRRG